MEWFKRNGSYLIPVGKNWILMQVLQGWKLSAAVNLPACYKIDETYIASKYNTIQELNFQEVCVMFQVSHQRNKQSTPSVTVFGASYVTPNIVELIDEFL